jgi:hypothetical protein
MRGRYWKLSERFVNERWVQLWNLHQSITSLLPLYAVDQYPAQGERWTRPITHPERHVAALVGIDRETVSLALEAGHEAGVWRLDGNAQPGRRARGCSVSEECYRRSGEEYVKIPATLVYGGTWGLIPTPAARHLYLALAALDPIHDVEAYASHERDRLIEEEYWSWPDDSLWDCNLEADVVETIARRRRQARLWSVSELAREFGPTRGAMRSALESLCIRGAGLLRVGYVGEARYFGHVLPHVEVYDPADLNDPVRRAALKKWRWDRGNIFNFHVRYGECLDVGGSRPAKGGSKPATGVAVNQPLEGVVLKKESTECVASRLQAA